MKRPQKIALLNQVLQGQTDELRKIQATRGRAYTPTERAEQKQYLTELYGYEATDAEVNRFFARDLSGVPGTTVYELPNGMNLFFAPGQAITTYD